jgi:hypothetical protein
VNGKLVVLAYAACGYLIVVYAWGRHSDVPLRKVGLFLLVFLALGGPLFAHATSLARQQSGGLMVANVAHVQLVTIGMAVWLMQRHAYFGRALGDPPRFAAYIANSIIAATFGAGICLVFHLGDADPLAATGRFLRVLLLSFPLCAAVAFFRDQWAGDTTRSVWVRRVETTGCTLVMALGIALLCFGEQLPFATDSLQGWWLAVLIAASSALAVMIGSCVPRTHRAEGAGAGGPSGTDVMAVEDSEDDHRAVPAAKQLVAEPWQLFQLTRRPASAALAKLSGPGLHAADDRQPETGR